MVQYLYIKAGDVMDSMIITDLNHLKWMVSTACYIDSLKLCATRDSIIIYYIENFISVESVQVVC